MQMVATEDNLISFSCNADVTLDMIPKMRMKNYPTLVIGQVNQNLPFMYGDAVVKEHEFDILVDNPNQYYKVFGPPKMSISDTDYMIGLYASSLVKDNGELQVGIGSLGDAVIYGLILKEKENAIYKEVLERTHFLSRFKDVVQRVGSLEKFSLGLFGATEMMVDGFIELYKNGILKKKVYDNIALQRLINQKLLDPINIDEGVIEHLVGKGIISFPLSEKDFNFLKHWGIINDQESFVPNMTSLKPQQLGTELKNGQIVHAGFFLGPTSFYHFLKELPKEERKLFSTKSVRKVNHLYGHEELDRLHRKNARFINTCMMTTLSGAHVSDGLEDGRVVSGVGGQFNFVSMAQELPDGHSILTMRATRSKKGKVFSNIVFNYGHITVPRHMRDILVTEYGVAFLRGKTDEEIIIELLKVCDSRFQDDLMKKAKASGKLRAEYTLPADFKNNFPQAYQQVLKNCKAKGHFNPFPFGTDLTEVEIKVGGALKRLKAKIEAGLVSILSLLAHALLARPNSDQKKVLERLDLAQPKNLKEKVLQKLVTTELN